MSENINQSVRVKRRNYIKIETYKKVESKYTIYFFRVFLLEFLYIKTYSNVFRNIKVLNFAQSTKITADIQI